MKTYFIQNFDGSDICIVDNGNMEAEKTLLFLHGSNLNSDIFKHQFESPLLNKYRLVAINLPGNGKSGKAHSPEEVYTFKGLVRTVDHCLRQLDLTESIFVVGHSLGAHLITNNTDSPNMVAGAFLIGYPPLHELADFMRATIPIPSFGKIFTESLTEDDIAEVANDLINENHGEVDIKEMIRSIDPVFRRVYGSSIAEGVLCDEYETLQRFRNPVMLAHAGNDRFLRYEYFETANVPNLWESKVHVLEGASHLPFIDAAEATNALINQYVSQVV